MLVSFAISVAPAPPPPPPTSPPEDATFAEPPTEFVQIKPSKFKPKERPAADSAVNALIYPVNHKTWKEDVDTTTKALDNRAAAIVLICDEDDAPTFQKITLLLAKRLGGERPVFVAPVLDADSSISRWRDGIYYLPHARMRLPLGATREWSSAQEPTSDWHPNMRTDKAALLLVVKKLENWANGLLDECVASGECDEAIDQERAGEVRRERLEKEVERGVPRTPMMASRDEL